MGEIEIRRTKPDEYRAAADTMAGALMMRPPNDDEWPKRIASWDETVSYTAWRGDECVGHASFFPFDTVVPGGRRLPSGGVTRVGVRQTARRLGVASELMNQLTDTAAETGLALLSLRASEATIYRRFGYGVAGDYASAKIVPARARPVRGAAEHGSFRMLRPDEVLTVVPELYERVGQRRTGAVSRPPSFFRRYFENVIERSDSAFVVVHTGADGVDDGYVHYSTKWTDEAPVGPRGAGQIHELHAADDAVELALWRFVLDIDLVAEWRSDERPVDDLVVDALADRRAYAITALDDEQWVRLVDVDACLRTRAYNPIDGELVIEVADPRLTDNNGRWRIGAAGAVRDDAAPADLIVPIHAVSAAYLGGRRWWQLAGAGDVEATDPAAIALADALFVSPRAPFCGSFF
jgi:predicted acetyltransferase